MAMMNSRSRASRTGVWAALLVLCALVGAGGVAEAGKKRVVVLDFEGPKGNKFHDDLVRLIKKTHTVVSTDKWNGTAEEMGASDVSEKNLKKVAKKLKVDAIVEGKIEKRRDEFIIRLKLHAGSSGEQIGNPVDTKAESAKIDGRAQRDIKDELLDAIDNVDGHAGGGGDDDDDKSVAKKGGKKTDDDDDDKPTKKGFGRLSDDARGGDKVTKKGGKKTDDDDDKSVAKKGGKKTDDDDKPAKLAKTDDDDKPAKLAKKTDDDKPVKLAKKTDDDDKLPPKKVGKPADDDDKLPPKKAGKPADDDKLPPKKAGKPADDDKLPPKKAGNPGDDDDKLPPKKVAKKTDDDKLQPKKAAKKTDDDKPVKKRVAVRSDDDNNELEAEASPRVDPATALSPGERAIDAVLGLSFTMRRLAFGIRPGLLATPPAYKGNPLPGATIDATVYPLAIGHARADLLKNLGLNLTFDRAFKLTTKDAKGMQYAGASGRFGFGAVFRYAFGRSPTAPVVLGSLGYSSQAFSITTSSSANMSGIPNVRYKSIEPGVGIRFPITPKIIANLDVKTMAMLDAGQIQAQTQYGTTDLLAFEGSIGADYLVTPNIFARAAFHAETIGMKFHGNGTLSNLRDNDPTTQDVLTARDNYFGGMVTVGYLY
jgi:hypothetical protein